MITITTTFDFGKLERKLPDILKHFGNIGAKALAADARSMIKDGKLRNVTEGTMKIAEKRLSPKKLKNRLQGLEKREGNL